MRFLLIIAALLAVLLYIRSTSGVPPVGTTWGDGANSPVSVIKAHPDDLSDQQGDAVKAAPLVARRYLFLYYSAGWCPPCHAFTPRLVAFDRAHTAQRDFEIVLVSNDRSPEALAAYAKEFDMPFAIADYGSALHRQLIEARHDPGIPDLMLFEVASGKLLAATYSDGRYLGPQTVLKAYKSLTGG